MQSVEIKQLLALSKDIFSGTLQETPENTYQILTVMQAEMGVAEARQVRFLATTGALDCFIVSAYDRRQKMGTLAHIDGLTRVEYLVNSLLDPLHFFSLSREGIRLDMQLTLNAGSHAMSEYMADVYRQVFEFVESVERGQPIDVKVGPIFTQRSESLALDLEDGTLLKFSPNLSLNRRVREFKMDLLGRSLEVMASGKKFPKWIKPND